MVESSVGHIRDLPDRAAEIPEEYKGQAWARLGVDVEHDFEPLYIVDPDKRKKVSELRKLLADSDELLLATDEDREGEAIAWHLLEVLKPKVPVRRMVFHEITREAIERALEHPRSIDERLVDAQETRRILDRLYGYEVSPVLWKKVMRGLSAGRVQSVATRLVVERERERMRFRRRSTGTSRRRSTRSRSRRGSPRSTASGSRTGRDFGPDGKLRNADVGHARRGGARARSPDGSSRPSFRVGRVERKPYVPPAEPAVHDLDAAAGGQPQAALHGADDDAGRPAAVRERLHHLHAHRLDDAVGVGAHGGALAGRARSTGRSTCPAAPRRYERQVKNAQEAHEAIRPSGDAFRTPAGGAAAS